MKVLHVTQGYYPAIGGTERLIQRISEELVRQFDDEVTVFTTDCYGGEAFSRPWLPHLPQGWETQAGVKIRRFGVRRELGWLSFWPQAIAQRLRLPFEQHLRTWYSGPVMPGLTRAIRQHPADVVVASSFPLMHMYYAVKGARQSNRPCVLIGGMHPDDHWGFDRPMIHQAIHQATMYMAYTGYEANYVVGRGANPEQVAITGVGVDPEPFTGIDALEAKRRLGLAGKQVVAFIGQVAAAKGVGTLVEAMPAVWQRFPDAHLLIAGGWTVFAGRLQEMLDGEFAPFRDRVTVRYNFPEEEKAHYFSAVDVFAYPSGYESFGIAFLEAWTAGKPVIGCQRGAIPWVVEAGKDGLLVPFQDATALSGAIQLLLGNRAWARALGEAGRRKALGRFTWAEMGRRFREVYQAAIERARHTSDHDVSSHRPSEEFFS